MSLWLLPLSWLYGLGVRMRNMLFDMGILPSQTYDIPIINVGNITVGGTGKTPHSEYLIRLLSRHYQVAVLSRGYKRKSKGYVLATSNTPMEQIGDEPWQMKQKFPHIHVAVDANRRRGIQRILADKATRNTQVILLDDAYQHRYVQPGLNILLTDYNRPITADQLLPAGRLREPIEGKHRADVVIVTKCPDSLTPRDYRTMQQSLALRPYQQLFYSTFHYAPLAPVFASGSKRELNSLSPDDHILLITGIASPQQMCKDLQRHSKNITLQVFPDHHYFTPEDVERLNAAFEALPHPRLAVTTEKDVTRLLSTPGLSDTLRKALYRLPIEVRILREETETFDKKILDYVHKNSRNRDLAEK